MLLALAIYADSIYLEWWWRTWSDEKAKLAMPNTPTPYWEHGFSGQFATFWLLLAYLGLAVMSAGVV